MFYVIFEDGKVEYQKNITKDALNASMDGYITLIDATTNTEYIGGQWVPIEATG